MRNRELKPLFSSAAAFIDSKSENLVNKCLEGLPMRRYSAVNYDLLRDIAKLKKDDCSYQIASIARLNETSKQSKEQALLSHHKFLWHQEYRQLQEKEATCLLDLNSLCMEENVLELCELKASLDADVQTFTTDAVQPFFKLRENIVDWLRSRKSKVEDVKTLQANHSKIKWALSQLMDVQNKAMHDLSKDQVQLKLESDLAVIQGQIGKTERRVHEGIPEEAMMLEYPDQNLLSTVLSEFNLLDGRFTERLKLLETKYTEQRRHNGRGDWDIKDHETFVTVAEIYTASETNNRRAYYIDMLKRMLPHKKHSELVAHEEEWLLAKKYHAQRDAVLASWHRSKVDLLKKIQTVFAEALIHNEEETHAARDKEKQHMKCQLLYAKVSLWREQQLEMTRVQQELENQAREEAARHEQFQAEMKRRKTAKQKKRVQRYKERKDYEKQAEQAEQCRHLEDIQKHILKLSEIGKERIAYRDKLLHAKHVQRDELEEKRRIAEAERERRLTLIRQKVAVHVEPDSQRVCSATICSDARRGFGATDEQPIQTPLFSVTSFTDSQVSADPRFKLEMRLREAGLLQSEYARHMLKNTRPLKLPRPDVKSNVSFTQMEGM
ncbi:PREDICTED: coiled-coil domain-containing protein 148-like isoform X2 [Priapulus caudatus]|uniref:Coiled-coil domain-containing protein 148-like isoform X2 n=1 Tax=Priapulus caudatus TaxID=37621 RepID=A0ABM1EQK3_PRICU|nr:PREDICTED: coiled-coil domain-containing protein 148-like isoform X2 [Priapulus caudatus]